MLRGSSLRRFTKRRNCPTLRGHQSDNLSFKEDGMTRRSMPSSFHANLFALVPARCPSSTCGVLVAGRWQLGTLLVPVLHRVVGKMRPGFWPNNGSRFPNGVGCGKCDPEYCSKTGCRFPDGAQAESASHSGAPKRDALSSRKNCRSRVERRLRYSSRISAASSSWVSTT